MLSRQLVASRTLSYYRTRQFSCSTQVLSNRAIVYSGNGSPSSVLSVFTYPDLPPPPPGTLNIRFLLSPINPADINVVEGIYPTKPKERTSLAALGKGSEDEPLYIGGNEGLAQVTDVGNDVKGLKREDWVVMAKPQSGTWSSRQNVAANDVLKIPRGESDVPLSDVHGATMTVNPPTAYNMLHDFVRLEEGDWVMQNGGNSSVGQAVIQIAASKGIKTINFVRNREDLDYLIGQLETLGATKVLTYDDLSDKNLRSRIMEWTGGKEIKLGLNCVGGQETTHMARLLGIDAHLVSYGAMSRQPLALPTSLFIFRNLKSHGFWQTRWYETRSREEKDRLMHTLVKLMTEGKLKEPEHEIVTIRAEENDDEAGQKVRNVFTKISEGRHGKKVLLRFEDID